MQTLKLKVKIIGIKIINTMLLYPLDVTKVK